MVFMEIISYQNSAKIQSYDVAKYKMTSKFEVRTNQET